MYPILHWILNSSCAEWPNSPCAAVAKAMASCTGNSMAQPQGVRAGVRVGWLKGFVSSQIRNGMTTREVVDEIIRPATRGQRCRYVALMGTGDVGVAQTFVSHTWNASFRDLVGSILHVLPEDAFVWCDIFAIAQHEPADPADLAFAPVVTACSSLLLVGQHVPSISQMTDEKVFLKEVPAQAKLECSFFRVWVLVELVAALQAGIPVVMLVGTTDANLKFRPRPSMLTNLASILDVEQASASREEDRYRIIEEVRAGPGVAAANALALRAALGSQLCMQEKEVMSAAIGDLGPLARLQGREALGRALRGAANAELLTPLAALLARAPADVDVDAPDPLTGTTSLILASSGGGLRSLQALLAAGADPHLTDKRGLTCLMACSLYRGLPEVVQTILATGVDPNARLTSTGGTALHAAAGGGNLSSIELLVRAAADVNVCANNGDGPLHRAAVGGSSESIKLLLNLGCSHINLTNSHGSTPLMLAAMSGNAMAVGELVRQGAEIDLRRFPSAAATATTTNAAVNAVAIANTHWSGGAQAAGGDGDSETATSLYMTRGMNYLRRVALLTSDQARFTGGQTALMDAARGGHATVVAVLLAQGAQVHLLNEAGYDALSISRQANEARMASPPSPNSASSFVHGRSIWASSKAAARAQATQDQQRHAAALELLEREVGVSA